MNHVLINRPGTAIEMGRILLLTLVFAFCGSVVSHATDEEIWLPSKRTIYGMVKNSPRSVPAATVLTHYHDYKEKKIAEWEHACNDGAPPVGLTASQCAQVQRLFEKNTPVSDPDWDEFEPFVPFYRAVFVINDRHLRKLYRELLAGLERNNANPVEGDGAKHLQLMWAYKTYIESDPELHTTELDTESHQIQFQKFLNSRAASDKSLVSFIPKDIIGTLIVPLEQQNWRAELKNDFRSARNAIVFSAVTCAMFIGGWNGYHALFHQPPAQRAQEKFQPYADDAPHGNKTYNDASGQNAAEKAAQDQAERALPDLLP